MFCFKVVTDSQPAARRYLQTKLSHTDRQRVKYLLQVWLIINSQYGSLNGRVGPRGLISQYRSLNGHVGPTGLNS